MFAVNSVRGAYGRRRNSEGACQNDNMTRGCGKALHDKEMTYGVTNHYVVVVLMRWCSARRRESDDICVL